MRAILSFDVPAAVRHFGGHRSLIALFAKHRLSTVNKPMIDQWKNRNNVPSWVIVEMARIAKLERIKFQLEAFTIVNQNPKEPKRVGTHQ